MYFKFHRKMSIDTSVGVDAGSESEYLVNILLAVPNGNRSVNVSFV